MNPEPRRPVAWTLSILALELAGFLLAAELAFGADPAPALQESPPAVKAALTEVITGQIAAFRAHDYARAYTFASHDFRAMLSQDAFETMVKSNYPVLAHAVSTDFGPALDEGGEGLVYVRITDAEGNRKVYRYSLRREKDGWKITGVTPVDDVPAEAAPLSA